MLDLNQIAGPTPNRSRDLFVESPQVYYFKNIFYYQPPPQYCSQEFRGGGNFLVDPQRRNFFNAKNAQKITIFVEQSGNF
jgi:hypothetical protein